MSRLMITAIAAFVLGVGATTLLQSHSFSTNGHVGIASLAAPQGVQIPGTANSLPAEDFEDRSLVFPRQGKTGTGD